MKNKLWIFGTWLWLLSLAVLVAIYSAWLIYPLEVDWLKLTLQVTITKADLLKNFNVSMTYLTNPLSHTLAMPDFPSSASGLKHFGDVKHLFHLAQAVFILLAYPSWHFLKNSRAEKSLFLHQRAFTLAAILPIVIAVVGLLIGFDQFFTLFHEMLFPGDSSWLFNPATDPIIWVLPEEYFMHCFIIFFVTYEALMLSLLVIARKQLAERLVHHGKEKG
ncbi:TIGR01906 family membrane protein [uncultured Streptococcus sp.]|uniref:TIGR01906 family membrane protein n=1 Tax=uncultured Streptococcus sp. TaxID=83427 RepID=UPI0025921554|nr:TIGR01906 family membrane protein [uncultured Streptococcus sp.]